MKRPRLRRGRRPRGRRRTLVGFIVSLLGLGALAGGWLWLRDSSLVAVRDVRIGGLTVRDAPQIRTALRGAARSMTTLHVRTDELRDAISAFPAVKDVRVHTDFPHGLQIQVIENDAVARIDAGGRTVAAAADGALLPGEQAGDGLPRVALDAFPTGPRVRDTRTLGLLVVAGATPGALRPLVERIRRGREGVRAELRGGLKVIFGSRVQAAAKWAAAARVIADPASAGANYIDVRVPERPVAGGFSSGSGSAAASAENPSTQPSNGDPSAAPGESPIPTATARVGGA